MLGVQGVTTALPTRRLRWYGHVARSSSCINSITNMTIPSARRRGRPKKTWSECVKTDMKMCSLGSIDPLNRIKSSQGGHFVQWSGATCAIFGRGQLSLDRWFRRRCLKIFPISRFGSPFFDGDESYNQIVFVMEGKCLF